MQAKHADMTGKTVILTGASRGIGRSTALALGAAGADLGLVCRDAARADEAVGAVRAAGARGAIDVFYADLSSLADMKRVAGEIDARYPRIDVLLNNAGGIFPERRSTVDGLEHTFAVNHLAYFVVTALLAPKLRASAPARVVNVASTAHRGVALDFDDLQSERGYSAFRVYSRSKLANVLFTRELARRLAGSGVTANCLHPGVIASHFGQSEGGLLALVMKIGKPFLSTPEKGARTSVYLASSPEVATVTGGYFDDCRVAKPSRQAQDDDAAARLFRVSEELTGLTFPA